MDHVRDVFKHLQILTVYRFGVLETTKICRTTGKRKLFSLPSNIQ